MMVPTDAKHTLSTKMGYIFICRCLECIVVLFFFFTGSRHKAGVHIATHHGCPFPFVLQDFAVVKKDGLGDDLSGGAGELDFCRVNLYEHALP